MRGLFHKHRSAGRLRPVLRLQLPGVRGSECGAIVKIHHLKSWPSSYQPVKLGFKTAEFRVNDRDFHLDDLLCLEEWIPEGNQKELLEADDIDEYGYTGNEQLDQLEDERQFDASEVERKVTSPDSNRKIIEELA